MTRVIFGSADFKRAEDVFTNGKLEELNQIKEMAFARFDYNPRARPEDRLTTPSLPLCARPSR